MRIDVAFTWNATWIFPLFYPREQKKDRRKQEEQETEKQTEKRDQKKAKHFTGSDMQNKTNPNKKIKSFGSDVIAGLLVTSFPLFLSSLVLVLDVFHIFNVLALILWSYIKGSNQKQR